MCVLCQIDPVNAENGNHDELVKSLSQTQIQSPGTSTTPVTPVDIPGDATTTAEVTVGGSFTGTIETALDRDWIKVTLKAGQRYIFDLEGIDDPATPKGALGDPVMAVRDANGNLVAFDDDDGSGWNSRLTFVAPASGTYHVEARGYGTETGDYRLTVKVKPETQRSMGSLDELADFLTHGFFSPRKFNLGSDGINPKNGVITYTLDGNRLDSDGLTEDRAEAVREAFRLYEAILGIDFRKPPRRPPTSASRTDLAGLGRITSTAGTPTVRATYSTPTSTFPVPTAEVWGQRNSPRSCTRSGMRSDWGTKGPTTAAAISIPTRNS